MQLRYQSEIRGDCLHIVAEGAVHSIDAMLDHIANMRREVALTGLSKLLADERKCHMHINFDGLKDIADALRTTPWRTTDLKVAVVSSSINHPLFQHIFDPIKRIKVFTDEAAAKQWLAED